MPVPKLNTAYQGISGTLKKVSLSLPNTLDPKEILLKITHSGLCGPDLHGITARSVIGHEGCGVVTAIGSEVTQFKIGDRAGGGFLRNSCGHCKYCLSGQEIWCYERDIFLQTVSGRQNGTIADYFVGRETYLYSIPDGMASEYAAPLMCAGATVYSALIDNVKPGDRVGIVGIGGLGHLAIQFAAKLGLEVVVFSRRRTKEAEARGFGATEFVCTHDPGEVSKPVDVLLLATSGYPDWEKPMLFDGWKLVNSLVATRQVHRDMLSFAALHQIKPTIEMFELSEAGVKAAINKLEAGTMRYRGMLVAG